MLLNEVTQDEVSALTCSLAVVVLVFTHTNCTYVYVVYIDSKLVFVV